MLKTQSISTHNSYLRYASNDFFILLNINYHQLPTNYPKIFFEKLTVNSWKLMLKIQSICPLNSYLRYASNDFFLILNS